MHITAFLICIWFVVFPSANAVRVDPDTAPISVPYNVNLSSVVELPFDYSSKPFSVVKAAPGCSPEQVILCGVHDPRGAIVQ